jgi:GT2 family glycosyltransferase
LRELRHCLKSAKGPSIEHILVLDGKQNANRLVSLRRLARRFGAKLEVVENQAGISSASNVGANLASGEFLVFLDQDDFLVRSWWKPLIQIIDGADYVYSDCFIADEAGKPSHLVRKPAFSPTRLIFNMYAVHFMAVRKSIFEQVGGFRSELDGSQDHDLALRVSRVTNRFEHIPVPLYNWRESRNSTASNPDNKKWAFDSGLAAAQDHLQTFSPEASLEKLEGFPGALRAKFPERTDPVSIVIPTAFQASPTGHLYVDNLLESISPFLCSKLGDEIVIVHGGEKNEGVIAGAKEFKGIPISQVEDQAVFNFSRRCNIGFLSTNNEHVLLLNDDIEFGEENPFNGLFGLLSLPNVGLVGAMLAFPGFTIQHGGHTFKGGLVGHAYYRETSLKQPMMDLVVDHEVVGVTGALMFQRKSTWQAVGGFSHAFPLNYNDVDYCQKIRTLGYNIVQANSVTAIHHESVTRESNIETWELDLLNQRWQDVLSKDEFSISG